MHSKSLDLGKDNIWKLIVRLSLPTIAILLIASLYNFVDQIFVGNSYVGEIGNTGIGVAFPAQLIALAFAWCFGDGAAAFLSTKQGEKKLENIEKHIGASFSYVLIISIILMIIFLSASNPILTFFGASDTALSYARAYLIPIVIAFPFYMLQNCATSIIRSDGGINFALIATAIGAALNVGLDPLFIYGFKMGVSGAGWATSISMMVTFVITMLYFFKSKSFKLKPSSFIPNFKNIIPIIKLGVASFVTQIVVAIVNLASNKVIAKYGLTSIYGVDGPMAAIANQSKVFSIIINITVGCILGAQPIISYNMGAKNIKRVKQTYFNVLIAVTAFNIIYTILNEVCPEIFLFMFGKGDKPTAQLYEEYGKLVFRLYNSTIIVTSFVKITSVFLQAISKPIKSIICQFSRDLLFVLLVILLPVIAEANTKGSGITSFLYAQPLSDSIVLIPTIVILFTTLKQLNNIEIKNKEDSLINA